VVGEYHSAIARPVADLALRLDLPFVCSSATIDRLTDAPADTVARLAAAQSHGWRVYADHLLAAGRRHVAIAIQPDVYWSAGAAILEARLRAGGARCARIDVTGLSDAAVADRPRAVDDLGALLLLVAYPEPAAGIVRALRADRRFDRTLVGDPAGRAEFREWLDLLGDDGLGVPYLRYVAGALSEPGADVAERLAERLGEPPSFVALEGYDTMLVVGEALRLAGGDRERLGRALGAVDVRGTRGRIRFTRTRGVPVLQWAWPPVQVAAIDGRRPGRVTVLHQEA
jgi:ABC-type branched-subunit amino acid transport system substrate-binding protein